ncbi:MAG: GAF domain-containing protein [Armatimonadetes bacterium]|nr:GAF domain-containing protein [Armatimonadota bacterium]NIM24889.1 GAF domain-containing protein [Armatimonadota bacterium]NIM68778.1 GAF domain-containing protein [Armatimonadota bacterium]NIM77040.1 GAF domain-containing protein [Armatimonadota bacterium]NIN06975.1 GAF domain-containing protein [Armatimonadota bacterium]
MKAFALLRLPFLRARRDKDLDPLTEGERTEERLWLLALLLIFLLAVGLFLLSAAQDMTTSTVASEFAAPLVAVLGNDVTTSLLLVMVLLICAYFRERLVDRREEKRRLVESLCAANESLQRRTHQLATWGELSHALIANFDLPSLLDLIVTTAIEVTQAENGSVMLLDDERKALHIAAAQGLSKEVVEQTSIPMGEGIAGWVAKRGEPLLLAHSNPDPRIRERLQREDIFSAISVPLRVDAAVVGTLNVSESSRDKEFNHDDLRALSIFANQAALALEKAHLYRESQAQLEKMLRLLGELQSAQQQLIHTEKLASVGTLAGGVAHEINNPLMVILGRTELMQMRDDLPKSVRNDLEVMRTETTRISEIVRGLLTFSRRSQDDTFEQVDVNEVIGKTLTLTENQLRNDNIKVRRELNQNLPTIEANAGQLQQVFTNMIINARHAMPDGGTVVVRTSKVAEGQVTVEIQDNGCGIPEEDLPKIFDPFFTTKEEGKGTGLGLSVSHNIITRHGGDIGVSSELGKGTIFTIQLPVTGAAKTSADLDEQAQENAVSLV